MRLIINDQLYFQGEIEERQGAVWGKKVLKTSHPYLAMRVHPFYKDVD